MKCIHYDKSGVTLLELMIAIALFAIAGTASLNSYLLSMRHLQIINEHKNLLLLSRLKIEELKIETTDIKEGASGGGFDVPFEKYTWEIEPSDLTITDTEYEITYTPYKLEVKTENRDYSVITPFLKITEKNRVDRIQ